MMCQPENSRSFSLNDCLETGPALQNLLWSVLIRTRFKPTALCGDLQKAFLQIGQYALFIPWRSILAVRIVHEAHKRTMNGGVISTMAALREKYWITKLQQLTKRVIRNCFGCKSCEVNPFATPLQGQLPIDRTTGSYSFQVVGTDFTGPIMYCTKNKREKKSYIFLFTCSLTRAIHLELLPDQTK